MTRTGGIQSDYKKPTPMEYPEAKKHKKISFIKSAIRIIGYIFLPIHIPSAAILLIISGIVGIVEALV